MSTSRNRSHGWWTTAKSLAPMISAPDGRSAGGAPSSTHCVADRQRPAADVEDERDAGARRGGPRTGRGPGDPGSGHRAPAPGSTPRAGRGPARRRARSSEPSSSRSHRATPCRRASPAQNAAIARLWARYAPWRSTGSAIENSGAHSEENTTWWRKPSRSRAVLRSAGSTPPSAACHFGPRLISSSPSATSASRSSSSVRPSGQVESGASAGHRVAGGRARAGRRGR